MYEKDSTFRHVLPEPSRGDREWQRLWHEDIANLTETAIWAERATIANSLARRIYQERRDRMLWVTGDGTLITQRGWLTERLRRLEAEATRRQRRGRAA